MKTKAMFHSISTLLTRNLHDVFGENDAARRRAAIDEIFSDDCVFYEPGGGVYRGRDEIDRVAGHCFSKASSRWSPRSNRAWIRCCASLQVREV